MIFSLGELVDVVIMSMAIGYMFQDSFGNIAHRTESYDPLRHYKKRFDFSGFKFAVMAAAPAIILHELGHKFTALNFGFDATFHAAYTWLFIGVMLKLLNFGFIFFVPAYVSYSGAVSAMQSSMIAFAGPFVNLLLWVIPYVLLKQDIKMKSKTRALLFMTSRINMFLFIFNMLPIPMFDGYHVFRGLISAFF